MTAEAYIVIEEWQGGELVRQRVPYVAPVFPERDYVIAERSTGAPILDAPGKLRPVSAGDVRFLAGVTHVQEPYRRLRHRHDYMHATRYTEAEAQARIAQWPELNGVAVPWSELSVS